MSKITVLANERAACLQLVDPLPEMWAEYQAFLDEFIAAGEEGILYNLPDENGSLQECIRQLKNHTEGFDRSSGCVPCSAYWLLSDEGTLIGEIHIRHRLTLALEEYGGHVGYMIRPGERGKGHATRMLALGLEKARAMGLKGVIITCDPQNAASIRVAMNNGGKPLNQSASGVCRITCRYWIDLP